jgi:DNA-binding NtrC family response regulator
VARITQTSQEQQMSTGPDYPSEAPAASSARLESARMRVLFVADRSLLAAEVRSVLEKSQRGDFELVLERGLDAATHRLHGERFDLLLLDLALVDTRRSLLVDRASELATRLPVVALSGTESFGQLDPGAPRSIRAELEEADLAAVLHRTLRRAQRLGTVALAPVFCRLERFGC